MSDSREEMQAAALFEAECATNKSDLISRALHRRELAEKDAVIKLLADALLLLKKNRALLLDEEHVAIDTSLRLAGRL